MAAYTTIDDSSAHYQGLAYRGDSSSTTSSDRNLTNTGNSDLQPDWIWLFNRDTQLTGGQKIFDSTRGAGSGKSLSSSITNAEGYQDAAYGYVNSFNSDGFGVRAGTDTNRWFVDRGAGGGDRYVAFQWKAGGGTTSSNSDGNITSTVQANTTAGFSIVTWTGDGSTSGKNVGHGLGAVPKFIISKDRGGASSLPGWHIYHPDVGNTHHLTFTTEAKVDSPTWGDTDPTSSVFSVGGDGGYIATNTSSTNYVAYCFAEKQGFSKFGKYVGNGNSDGPYVWTGFRPAFIMFKPIGESSDWTICDTKRNTHNPTADLTINANLTTGDHDGGMDFDILSTGFKVRNANTDNNSSDSAGIVYMAFAEQPFVNSNGVPANAR